MINLSVNVNKVAWLRNARAGSRPDVTAAARTIIAAGAQGHSLDVLDNLFVGGQNLEVGPAPARHLSENCRTRL